MMNAVYEKRFAKEPEMREPQVADQVEASA